MMFLVAHVLATMQPPGGNRAAAPPARRAVPPRSPADGLAEEATRFLAGGTLPRPHRRAQVGALLHRRVLDARLRAGDNALADRALATRAAQLVDPAARRRLAARLERAATAPRNPSSRTFLATYADEELRALAVALRERPSVDERGVALAHALLRDAALPRDITAFRAAALYALACLDPAAAAHVRRR